MRIDCGITLACQHRAHTGGSGDIEVDTARWYSLWEMNSLPQGAVTWTAFQQECGQPGVLDRGSGYVTVAARNADLNSE